MTEPARTTGIRVLIVDDHPLFRDGIRERLESAGDTFLVVGEATGGAEAHELVGSTAPDVVLMDIAMPQMNGIDATRLIHADFPDVDIIMLSVYDDAQYVNAALEAGASGYLLKSVEAADLRDSVVRTARGESALSPSVARTLVTRLTHPPAEASRLSEREREILSLVAGGASNKAVAKELFLSARTVEAHLRNIFDKLGVSSRTEAVTQAVRHQWIHLDDA
jgi:DNA-binding NarL/FixJ family response regulator